MVMEAALASTESFSWSVAVRVMRGLAPGVFFVMGTLLFS
jgi:hypothetical protein